MKKIIVSLLLITVVLIGCKKEEDKKSELTDSQSKLLELVNQHRKSGAECGSEYYPTVAPVTWNDLITKAATIHVNDMDEKDFFNHKGSDSSSAGDRLKRVGFEWQTWGENIAKGHKTEEDVINAWIKSEGHCKNIMNPKFKEMGVAKKGEYWTQVFATKK